MISSVIQCHGFEYAVTSFFYAKREISLHFVDVQNDPVKGFKQNIFKHGYHIHYCSVDRYRARFS
jgi:hypothetical protein